MIYIGADHRGFELKEKTKVWLAEQGYEVEDVGDHVFDPGDDYVDYAIKVAESIEGNGGDSRGILLCGSGHGMDIAANRFPRVRAILAFNDEVTVQGRNDENANVLVLPANWATEAEVIERVRLFLVTEAGEAPRYARRIQKFEELKIQR